ncbi:MAG: MFS transporter [Clostridia bacterium]|nr:DUF6050 family protein [Anaerostipes sp.]NCB94307.1 MFS transporter [Clostridia bacterium]
MKWFMKGIVPLLVVGFLLYVFKTVYVVDGKLDYFRLWMLFGIPFGLTRLCIWFLPRGYDIGGTVGMLAMSVVLAGLVGGFIAVFTILQAVYYSLIYPGIHYLQRRKVIL